MLIESLARKVQSLEADVRSKDAVHAKEIAAVYLQLDGALQERAELRQHMQRGKQHMQDLSDAHKRALTSLTVLTSHRDALVAEVAQLRAEVSATIAQRDHAAAQRDQVVDVLSNVRDTRDMLLAAHRDEEAGMAGHTDELRSVIARAAADHTALQSLVESKIQAAQSNSEASSRFKDAVSAKVSAAADSVTAFKAEQSSKHAALTSGLQGLSEEMNAARALVQQHITTASSTFDTFLAGLRVEMETLSAAAVKTARASEAEASAQVTAATTLIAGLREAVGSEVTSLRSAQDALEEELNGRLGELHSRVERWGGDLARFGSNMSSELAALQAQIDQAAEKQSVSADAHSATIAALVDSGKAAAAASGERLIHEVHVAVTRLVRAHLEEGHARAVQDGQRLTAEAQALAAQATASATSAGGTISDLQELLQERAVTDGVEASSFGEDVTACRSGVRGGIEGLGSGAEAVFTELKGGSTALRSQLSATATASAANADALVSSLSSASTECATHITSARHNAAESSRALSEMISGHAVNSAAAVTKLHDAQSAIVASVEDFSAVAHSRQQLLQGVVNTFVSTELRHATEPAPSVTPPVLLPQRASLAPYSDLIRAKAEARTSIGGLARKDAMVRRLTDQWAREEAITGGAEAKDTELAAHWTAPPASAPNSGSAQSKISSAGGGKQAQPTTPNTAKPSSPQPASPGSDGAAIAQLAQEIEVWMAGASALASSQAAKTLRTADSRGSLGSTFSRGERRW